jgi:hypothetical protein
LEGDGAGRSVLSLVAIFGGRLDEGVIVNENFALSTSATDEGIVVRALSIEARGVSVAAGPTVRGVFLNKCSNSTVEDVEVIGTPAEAIRFDVTVDQPTIISRDNSIRRCRLLRPGAGGDTVLVRSGVLGGGPSGAPAPARMRDLTISESTIVGGAHGIAISHVDGWGVSDCVVRDCGSRGVIFGPGTSHGVIAGNRIAGSGSTGIHGCYGNHAIVVTGNTVTGTRADGSGAGQEGQGIKLYTGFDAVVIIGNVCDGNATDGIALEGGGEARDFTVTGNVCVRNKRHGIYVRAGTVATSPGVPAVPHTAVSAGSISGNTCTQNAQSGVAIEAHPANSAAVEGLVLSSNVLTGNGAKPLHVPALLRAETLGNRS